MTQHVAPEGPPDHDHTRTAKFWTNLQSAMLHVGQHSFGVGQEAPIGDWCAEARREFNKRGWANATGIYGEQLRQFADSDPHFSRGRQGGDGVGGHDTITMTLEMECR